MMSKLVEQDLSQQLFAKQSEGQEKRDRGGCDDVVNDYMDRSR
jgi:hypothetical protein